MFDVVHYNETIGYTEVTGLEQLLYIPINIFIIIFGLFGNIAVLVGSTRYKALKMDKVSLTFVHNIALADIAFVFIRFIPTLVTLLAKKWVFGEMGCFLIGFLASVPTSVELLTIVLLSFYRLKVLKQTPTQRSLKFKRTMRMVRIILVSSWIMFLIIWFGSANMGFSVMPGPKATTCVIGYSFYGKAPNSSSVILTAVMLFGMLLTQLMAIFFINIYILYVICESSKKVKSETPRKVIATVPLVCMTYFASFVGTFFYAAILNFSQSLPEDAYIVVHYLESITLIANPFIYCIRDEFRQFIGRCMTFNLEHYSSVVSSKSGESDKMVDGADSAATRV